LAGETKTRAVKVALQERKKRLAAELSGRRRTDRLRKWLETEVWPNLPADVRGKPITKEEREEILGYGPEGV
jgi:antitoxin VapB